MEIDINKRIPLEGSWGLVVACIWALLVIGVRYTRPGREITRETTRLVISPVIGSHKVQ